MIPRSGFDARGIRDALRSRGGAIETGFIRYVYRPFDTRWLYWEGDSGLLDRPRPDYQQHVFEGNVWLSSAQHLRKEATGNSIRFCAPHGLISPDRTGNALVPGLATGRRPRHRRWRYTTSSQPVALSATLFGPPGSWCRGSVPPRHCHLAQSRVPHRQRRGAPDGVAAHSAAGLAGRQRR